MTLVLSDHGAAVGLLHQRLLELGYSVDPVELKASYFGATTLEAVLEFQSVRVGRKGTSLKADGVVGTDTAWALENPRGPEVKFVAPSWRYSSATMRAEARAACMSAICDIGKRERGDMNNGPELTKFDTKDMPWCAQAVSVWLEVIDGGSPLGKRMRSALKIVDWAKSKNRVVPAAEALAGDVWCALREDGHGHCELIVSVQPQGVLCLVGGNVGNAVRGTVRRADAATHIVRAIPVI